MIDTKFRYQNKRPCDQCGQQRLCLWFPTEPFRGQWLCGKCRYPEGDRTADVVKALDVATTNALPPQP